MFAHQPLDGGTHPTSGRASVHPLWDGHLQRPPRRRSTARPDLSPVPWEHGMVDDQGSVTGRNSSEAAPSPCALASRDRNSVIGDRRHTAEALGSPLHGLHLAHERTRAPKLVASGRYVGFRGERSHPWMIPLSRHSGWALGTAMLLLRRDLVIEASFRTVRLSTVAPEGRTRPAPVAARSAVARYEVSRRR